MTATCPPPAELQANPVASVLPRFAFEIKPHADCLQLVQPVERLDFNNLAVFASLAVFVAAYGSFRFSVAARPTPPRGSLRDWLFKLCADRSLEIERAAPVKIDGDLAAACLATQKTETGLLKMRIMLLEDGGRLFILTACAPAPLWRAYSGAFDEMFDSFRIAEKFGQTLAVT